MKRGVNIVISKEQETRTMCSGRRRQEGQRKRKDQALGGTSLRHYL